jgi:fused signal recognition particle receptor
VILPLLLAGALVLLGVWLLLRRRNRTISPPIRRDAPTFETAPVLGTRLGGLFRRSLDGAFWESLEEGLIAADVGVATSSALVEETQQREPTSASEARVFLRDAMIGSFAEIDRNLASKGAPVVIVIVGVNGSGKTTTIAKIAADHVESGQTVLVAAADTFRAAAAEQMILWGDRIGFDVVRGSDGADPAAVAHDALTAARARGRDVLIVDTAGRLHSKRNLMDELAKIVRVLGRDGESVDEVLLVLDGTTGQNGIAQARAFMEAVGVTGIAITKLDGSAKGGIAFAVERELGVPLKLVGVGERPEDLLHFEPERFVDELLGDA